MPKVKTWHSSKDTDVYHNNPKCTIGNNIEEANIRPGTGKKRLCKQCASLNAGK